MNALFQTPARTALSVVFALSLATILGAWGFELIGGFQPCELCYTQRIPYYIVVPLAGLLLVLVLMGKAPAPLNRWAVLILGLVILAGGGIGAYHAGVEWGFWPGPTSCTGGGLSSGLPDLSKKVVMCDEVQLRILGLSFAGWNAVVSTFIFAVSVWGFAAHPRDTR